MKGCKLPDGPNADYEERVKRIDYLIEMQNNGFSIIEPNDNEVFLDLDTEEDYIEFKSRLERVENYFGILTKRIELPSKSGLPHRHVIVVFPFNFEYGERIAMQMALNSDPMREFLTLLRYLDSDEPHNILFRKDQQLCQTESSTEESSTGLDKS